MKVKVKDIRSMKTKISFDRLFSFSFFTSSFELHFFFEFTMSAEAIEARFLMLESQVKRLEERNTALEEKNILLEQQLKKQAKDRETDLVRFTATDNQLKAQLKQEVEERKVGDLAIIRNVGLPRDYSKVCDKPTHRFGSKGAGDGLFSTPYSVACNSQGEIIIADKDNHRIQVFDRNGKFMLKFGSKGRGNGQLKQPGGVTVDQRNNQIVVSDSANHRIQIFDEKGTFLRVFGSNGQGDGQFGGPRGLVVDQQGKYAVADHSNHRVQIFNSQGQFVWKIGSFGAGNAR